MAIDWEQMVGAPVVAVFGEAAPWPYYPVGAVVSPFSVIPIFDEAYKELIILDAQNPITDAHPVIGVNDSQFLQDPQQGDRLQNPKTGQFYIVNDIHPDSHGITVLMLNKTDPVSL